MIAILGLLKPQQRLFADELSQILINESSEFDESSRDSNVEDGQGRILDKAKGQAIEKLVRRKNKEDRRFINMTRVQHARRFGFKIRFNGLSLDMVPEEKLDDMT